MPSVVVPTFSSAIADADLKVSTTKGNCPEVGRSPAGDAGERVKDSIASGAQLKRMLVRKLSV